LDTKINFSSGADSSKHLVRPRLNTLLKKATQKPLVIVCAGAGYGKTRAVYDFVNESKTATIWMQLSKQDNMTTRFWESFVHSIAQVVGSHVEDFLSLGFPDTEEKMQRYCSFRDRSIAALPRQRYLTIFDDFHLIKNPDIIRFIERLIPSTPDNRSLIIISREDPPINISNLQAQDEVVRIQEEDLKFTKNELALYLERQGQPVDPPVLREIYDDIDGWAFSVSLVARSLENAPGYSGYARTVMKNNVFELIEEKVFKTTSEPLKKLLVRLSLIEHLSEELVAILAQRDEELLTELQQQNAFIRFDSHINAYLIHHLFLDFLSTRQDLLSDDEKRATWHTAAQWCREHEYTVDALDYYAKANDYVSIVSVLSDLPFFLPYDLALYLTDLFKQVPDEMFFQVELLAVMYLRAVLSTGDMQSFTILAADFEQRFLQLPQNILCKHSQGLIYYLRGLVRYFMSIVDETYDYDTYFAKMYEHLKDSPITPGRWLATNLGPWATGFGSERLEAVPLYIEASARMVGYINTCIPGIMTGIEDLAAGELNFYKHDLDAAKLPLFTTIEEARKVRQFETVHRALFYTMRSAFAQGKLDQARQALDAMEDLLDEQDYAQRFNTYDIALGWYYYVLRQSDLIPNWLKEGFSPYGNVFFPENFGNQMKARYQFMTKNFAPLLTYIDETKQRESILYGRIELLALEACAYYQMRDKSKALAVLRESYEKVALNGFLMPFVELGKAMRTLSAFALRQPDCGIPREWLETVHKRSSLYARYQAMMIAAYEKENGVSNLKALSSRETEVLHDLYAGLSRTDIAVKQGLSLSTVNMNIQGIYSKLHARNVADVIRIATEQKLV